MFLLFFWHNLRDAKLAAEMDNLKINLYQQRTIQIKVSQLDKAKIFHQHI